MADNKLQLAVLLLLLFVIAMAFAAWAWRSISKSNTASKALLERALANPDSISRLRLTDANPVTVGLGFEQDSLTELSHVTGVAAVRVFDRLRTLAPAARYEVNPPLDERAWVKTV